MTWQINPYPDDSILRACLNEQRLWAAYALGDLRPPFRERSTFGYASKNGEWAIMLDYRTSTFNALLPFGAPDGIAAIMAASSATLPQRCIISNGTSEMEAIFNHWYTLGKPEPLYRMVVHPATFQPYASGVVCEELGPQHIGEISAFYTINNVPTFSPDQVHHGIYAGVRRHGVLVAVGGTHFVDEADKLAAIGNVYTDAMLRGNGYVRAIISWLTQATIERGCTDVVLNVGQNDFGAQQMYEPLGFKTVASFWEAPALRK